MDCMGSTNQNEDDAIIRVAATSILAVGIAIIDCVGAIDGIHVLASVPIEQQNRFYDQKSTTTQNVLAAINFNLKFTYNLAGWEGSAHDSLILNDALERPHGLQIPQDKYYLVDAGYGLRKGFIPPYHGISYHLQEYSEFDLDPNDMIIQEVDVEAVIQPQNSQGSQRNQTQRERREEARQWSSKRD
ncbi:hypothetical protein P3S67_021772 [Capsicum chacoense]